MFMRMVQAACVCLLFVLASPQTCCSGTQVMRCSAFRGFFDRPGGDPDRVKLWKEQLKLIEPFKGNYATRHGNRNEERALSDYMLLSQHDVDSYGIKYLHDDDAHNWLAGSPDGLIDVPQAVSGKLQQWPDPSVLAPANLPVLAPPDCQQNVDSCWKHSQS